MTEPSNFKIPKYFTEFWTIKNVPYRDALYKVDLLKMLLDNGNYKTQDQWVEYSKQARANNSFYVGDFPLHHALFSSLFKLKNKLEVGEIRSFLEKQFNEKWLMTLTRIKYNSSGKDEIIHNCNMSSQYSIQDDFVGPDEYVKNSGNISNYKTLLGTDNLQEINYIYNWITGKDAYLWRVNSKPEEIDERVARFDAGAEVVDLDCSLNIKPYSTHPAFGIRAVKEKDSEKIFEMF